jgi:hypothetical protein
LSGLSSAATSLRHRRSGEPSKKILSYGRIPAPPNVIGSAEQDARPSHAKESTMKYMLLIYGNEDQMQKQENAVVGDLAAEAARDRPGHLARS